MIYCKILLDNNGEEAILNIMDREKLAHDLVKFYSAYDPYDFKDNYDNEEDAYNDMLIELGKLGQVRDLLYEINNILYEFDLEGINYSQFKKLYGNNTPRPDTIKYNLEELEKELSKEIKEEGEEKKMSKVENLAKEIATLMQWDTAYDFSQFSSFDDAVEIITNGLNIDIDTYMDYIENLISDLEYDGVFNGADFKDTYKLNVDPFAVSKKLEDMKVAEIKKRRRLYSSFSRRRKNR